MGNDDNYDLDDELVRSIEKLVEEETNVAKAFVDNSFVSDKADKAYSIDRSSITGNTVQEESTTKSYTDDDIDLGATRMIDQDVIQGNIKSAQNKSVNTSESADKKSLWISVSVVAAAFILVVAVAAGVIYSNRKSFSHNYEKGIELYNSGDMEGAGKYFEKAFATDDGKKNPVMIGYLADIYLADMDYADAINVLKTGLEYDVQNEDMLAKLAGIYYQQSDGAQLTELINRYDGEKASAALAQYIVSEPSPSEVPGTLKEPVELTLIAQDGCSIYYTTDGTQPSVGSIKYTKPIKIEKDSVTVKAIAVNKIGVISKTVNLTYTISLQAPEAAELTIDSTTAPEGTVIMIKNLEEGCKAYYTVDGTTPTANSIIYNDGIDLKPGSYVLSVVIINKANLSSPITRKNITIEAGKNYTYAEAQSILVARMKELNILNSMSRFSVSNYTPEFVFLSKKTIDGIEMYYIRLDVKEDLSTEGYYGVGVKDGKCYRVTGSGNNAKAVEY